MPLRHQTTIALPGFLRMFVSTFLLAAKLFIPVISFGATPPQPCKIQVVEKGTDWPVPLVELRTTHQVRLVSDNAGIIACDLPELMNRESWFEVIGHGYEVPKDGFGFRGVKLKPQPGQTLTLEVTRTMPSRRLGRLTGGGLLAESQKLGLYPDTPESGVLGCDSVLNAVHRGRLFWLWGDTTLAHYPLGIFDSTSATTPVQPLPPTLKPPLQFSFDYFRDARGAPRGVAKMPGDGPTWLTAYVSLPDARGQARLVASFTKIHSPLESYQWGLCVWNEEMSQFDRLRLLWTKSSAAPKPPHLPEGHPMFWKDEAGKEWVGFGNPFPTLRCPATFEAWQDPATWEKLTPQPFLVAAADGRKVKPHTGSIAWNPWRQRWVTVFMEHSGQPSVFGELWYAEAEKAVGPWGPAVKVLTHNHYTFYNPRLHAEFTPEGSSLLYFEGTYTMQFDNTKPAPTPRYDYNQILYQLDLEDPLLAPARKTTSPTGQP